MNLYSCLLAIALSCVCSVAESQNCSAPLNGGNASSTSTPLCPSATFFLSVTGASTGTGLAYQWESSADNSNWTDIAGADGPNYNSTQSKTTWYRRRMMCDSGGVAQSGSIQIVSKSHLDCYCTPSSGCTSGFTITRVQCGSIDNSSACGAVGYSDYTSTIPAADMNQGAMVPITVNVATGGSNRFVLCFIDYDQNGSFETREQSTFSHTGNNVYSGSIKVPYSARLGITRMRLVFSIWNWNACSPSSEAESEDYFVNITPKTTAATGHVYHVKPSAPGSDLTGSSWMNAATSLKQVIAYTSPGDTIKVASGTYYGSDRTNGIVLHDSVIMMGGYPSSGNPTNTDRNPATHPTILSGVINSTNPTSDYHILYANGIKGSQVDGFILEKGGSFFGTGFQVLGGGIFAHNSTGLLFKNIVIRSSNGSNNSAVLYASFSKLTLENLIVTYNESGQTNIQIDKSDVTFNNALIARNYGEYLLKATSSKINFRNSTIAGNRFRVSLVSLNSQSEVAFTNSVAYFNKTTSGSAEYVYSDANEFVLNASIATLKYSQLHVMNVGTNLITGAHPRFRDTTNVAGPDGWYFTQDDGYQLTNPCSPGLNAGSNAEAAGIVTDMTGQPRIFGTAVDVGAYEIQQAPAPVPGVIYVNASATGANNGSSWANAFTDLHKALVACSDTIKVAAGTYFPWKTIDNPSWYWIENKRVLYGAYPNTGNPTDADRNYEAHLTKINGEYAPGLHSYNVLRGYNLDSTSLLDGFQFTNTGNGASPEHATVLYSNCNNPVMSNCSFTGNTRRMFLGVNNKDLKLLNLKIYDNVRDANMYGMEVFGFTNSAKTTLKNCVFVNNRMSATTNYENEYGNLIWFRNTTGIVDSCQFLRNFASVMFNSGSNTKVSNSRFDGNWSGQSTVHVHNVNSDPIFTNCFFRDSAWTPYASHEGGHMENFQSNPTFINCQFYDGRVSRLGGVAYNDKSKPKFINCVFRNSTNAFFNAGGSDMELTNCIVTGARPSDDGPAFMYNHDSSPTITNTIVTNSTSTSGPLLVNDGNSSPKINNSIFWKNFFRNVGALSVNSVQRSEVANAGTSTVVAKNSMFELYDAGSANNNTKGVDPRFAHYENPLGPDSIWFSADDGLRFCDCSPAINTGDNSLNTNPTDITLQPRIFGSTIDRGAYELQTTLPPTSNTAFVSVAATGSNNGSSWTNAYTDLQLAVRNPCADTIRIAAGTYRPHATLRTEGFLINRNLVIQGSYTHNTDLRDVDATPSIISGNIGNPADSTDNSRGLIKAFYLDTLVVDGVVLADVNYNSYDEQFRRALDAEYIQRVFINNCRIRNNSTVVSASGLNLSHIQSYEVRRTVFSQNVGNAVTSMDNNGNGTKKFVDCIFENNMVDSRGAGLRVSDAGVVVYNNVFTGNRAMYGAGMSIEYNVNVMVVGCTFHKNVTLNSGAGAGLFSSTRNADNPGPLIRNSIFTENKRDNASETSPQNLFGDIYVLNPQPNYDNVDLKIHHTATSTPPAKSWGGGLISPTTIVYKNKTNPRGLDGLWFTADDGLQLSDCSNGVNKGANGAVFTDKDVAGNPRIFADTVDLGAYEHGGMPVWMGLLNTASDSLIANKENTDSLGWTHYYSNCRYLMSIKKGTQDIGTVGDGNFELKVITAAGYNSGIATNLTAAAYNTTGQPWYVMSRYWKVNTPRTVVDSILVRFPYTNADFTDVKGSNLSVTQHQDLHFFKVNASEPFDLSIPASAFFRYSHALAPTTSQWTYQSQDSIHLADYYVKSFSGGGGGAWYTGGMPDLTITSASANPASIGGGGTVTINFIEANISNAAPAGAHNVRFYLSADNLFNKANDTLLGTYVITRLNAASNTGTLSKQVIVPCGLPAGNYFVFVVADEMNGVTETNENNNLHTFSLTITTGISMPAVPVISSTPPPLCTGITATLTASSPGCTTCIYTWSDGSVGPSINVTTSGNYSVTATNACGSASSTKTISFDPGPNFSLSYPQSACMGSTISFTASGADSYYWSGPGLHATTGSTVNATPTTTGTQSFTVIGTANGCDATKTFNVTAYSSPVVTVSPAGVSNIAACGSVTLTASATGGGVETFVWTPATGLNTQVGQTVVASPPANITYTVRATTIFGCAGTTTKTVNVSAPIQPTIIISYSGCPGSTLSFIAYVTNAGTTPQYEWYVNSVKQSATGSTFVLNNAVNGMQVYAKLIATGICGGPLTATSTTQTINCITTALPVIDALESFSVSPNPTSGPVTVQLKLNTRKTVSFVVTDGYGKTVYNMQPLSMTGNVTKEIMLEDLAAGIYYLRVAIGGQSFVEKVIVVR